MDTKTPSTKRIFMSIGIPVVLGSLLTIWSVHMLHDYGFALFVSLPFFMGFASTVMYGYKREARIWDAVKIPTFTLLIFCLCLILSAIEGALCLIMMAPLGLLLGIAGGFLGYAIVRKSVKKPALHIFIAFLLVPVTAFVEPKPESKELSVNTAIEINAPIQTVWGLVVAFPELPPPTETMFKYGIAYPTDATIEGSGVGAVRYCNFNSGPFVEPITVWDEPHLLGFDVLEHPAPMQELSIWDVHAPHLEGYFVSKRGQFKLSELPNGHTLVEGTTWYTHDIKPSAYWRLWSNFIIHKIHLRVLNHIKITAEKKPAQ